MPSCTTSSSVYSSLPDQSKSASNAPGTVLATTVLVPCMENTALCAPLIHPHSVQQVMSVIACLGVLYLIYCHEPMCT